VISIESNPTLSMEGARVVFAVRESLSLLNLHSHSVNVHDRLLVADDCLQWIDTDDYVDSREPNIVLTGLGLGLSTRVNEASILLGSIHYVYVPGSLIFKLPILPQRDASTSGIQSY
jgi:hypothetical protein